MYLLDDIGTELLNRKGADIPDELTDDCIAKPVVVEVENVLDNLKKQIPSGGELFLLGKRITHIIAVRILNKG